jgi:hypothetical protein
MALADWPRVRGRKAEALETLETLEADDVGGADMLEVEVEVEEDKWG